MESRLLASGTTSMRPVVGDVARIVYGRSRKGNFACDQMRPSWATNETATGLADEVPHKRTANTRHLPVVVRHPPSLSWRTAANLVAGRRERLRGGVRGVATCQERTNRDEAGQNSANGSARRAHLDSAR
eukprot:scaffold176222_cov29-Tisochrysis_lutea.AAC.8